MPHSSIKKCAKMGQPDKSYVNCALEDFRVLLLKGKFWGSKFFATIQI